MKLNLIIPMGGGGTRFGKAGYETPKPLLEIYGKPFFFWAAQSVTKFIQTATITFVVLQEHVERFGIDKAIKNYYPNARIVVIPHVLPGAVMTCLAGIEALDNNGPILFNDCDHLFVCQEFYRFCEEERFNEPDGGLLTFKSSDSRFSYVECGSDGYAVRTVEKQVISENAICGAYYFKNPSTFKNAAEKYLRECSYTEYFVSGVYNVLAKAGARIKPFLVDAHVSFGTPEEFEAAQTDETHKELDL